MATLRSVLAGGGPNLVLLPSFQMIVVLTPLADVLENAGLGNLSNQLRRAMLSAGSNLAEGFGRDTHAQTRQFLNWALGSIHEVWYQFFISRITASKTKKQGMGPGYNYVEKGLLYSDREIREVKEDPGILTSKDVADFSPFSPAERANLEYLVLELYNCEDPKDALSVLRPILKGSMAADPVSNGRVDLTALALERCHGCGTPRPRGEGTEFRLDVEEEARPFYIGRKKIQCFVCKICVDKKGDPISMGKRGVRWPADITEKVVGISASHKDLHVVGH